MAVTRPGRAATMLQTEEDVLAYSSSDQPLPWRCLEKAWWFLRQLKNDDTRCIRSSRVDGGSASMTPRSSPLIGQSLDPIESHLCHLCCTSVFLAGGKRTLAIRYHILCAAFLQKVIPHIQTGSLRNQASSCQDPCSVVLYSSRPALTLPFIPKPHITYQLVYRVPSRRSVPFIFSK